MSFSFPSHAGIHEHITGHNFSDADGNPAGGNAKHVHVESALDGPITHERFNIDWQDGPVDRKGAGSANGAFVEDVLDVCARRLLFYENSAFACPENAEALEHVIAAIAALDRRRTARRAEGVEGQHKPHGDPTAPERFHPYQ